MKSARRCALAASAMAMAMVATACGGSSEAGPQSSVGLPDSVSIAVMRPMTGPIAFLGENASKGYELAVKEINEQGLLGDATLDVEYIDSKGESQTATQELTQLVASGKVSGVLASVSSTEALALSPLAEKSGLPIVYTQAGSDGVVVGDYTYRATPPMSDYYPLLKKFIEETGAKSLGIIFTEATPTLQEIGTKTLPDLAKELGIEVTKSVGTQATTLDYSAPISQVLRSKPDLVAVLLAGASNPTAMLQLRQAGYTGPVLGNSGASAGNLDPAGENAAGMVWATDFTSLTQTASSLAFVDAYTAEYGEAPINYAAEAYDAAWFMARAIKQAQSADRESIKDAMAEVASEPWTGALGEGLSWVDNDLQARGAVVEYNGSGEDLLYEG